MSLEDQAEELLALFQAEGAVNVLTNLGTVSTTTPNVLSDPTVAAYTKATLGVAGTVFQLPAAAQGKRLRLILVQDATGSRTASITTSTSPLKWVGAAAPTLTTTAGRTDILTFESFDGTNWFGSAQLNAN